MRPHLPVNDATHAPGPRTSVYSIPINEFTIAQFPSYRGIGTLKEAMQPTDAHSAAEWRNLLTDDVRRLVADVLTHRCGPSCFKYADKKLTRICRHGFYYIVDMADKVKLRRRGKALRSQLFVVT